MIDLVLFIGRIALVIILYLFLFVVMRTGIGLVKGQRKDAAIWCLDVEKGPQELRGLHIDVLEPIIVGRNPQSYEGPAAATIVISDPTASSVHARFSLQGQGPALVLEDRQSFDVSQRPSANGTWVNGRRIVSPVELRDGDEVQIANTFLRVGRR